MTYNMKEHNNLLFDKGAYAIFQKPPVPKCLHKLGKRRSSHSKHIHSLYVVVAVDVVQIPIFSPSQINIGP